MTLRRGNQLKMGVEAITETSRGRRLIPETPHEWREWVSASSTRNFMLRNTLVDWLELYGGDVGFTQAYSAESAFNNGKMWDLKRLFKDGRVLHL